MGKRAAKLAGLDFVDLDEVIEEREGKSIEEIFRVSGEDEFRKAERRALEEMARKDGEFVVACGGGTPCFFDNMELMNSHGKTIYLRLSAGRLASRLKNSKKNRPLLDGHRDDLKAFVEEKMKHREDFYLQAQVILREDLVTAQTIADILS